MMDEYFNELQEDDNSYLLKNKGTELSQEILSMYEMCCNQHDNKDFE
jgi:hypothetical protein